MLPFFLNFTDILNSKSSCAESSLLLRGVFSFLLCEFNMLNNSRPALVYYLFYSFWLIDGHQTRQYSAGSITAALQCKQPLALELGFFEGGVVSNVLS